MDKTDLVNMLRAEISNAQGVGDNSEATRALAMRYYLGEAGGGPVELGRHTNISTDVADMVEATIAQMVPALLSEPICEPIPANAGDVEAARQEGRLVNYVVMQLNAGDIQFQSSMRDALLQRNGWVKVWFDEGEETETRVWHGVQRETMAQAIASGRLGDPKEIEVEYETVGDGMVNATTKATKKRARLRVDSADPALLIWTVDFPSMDVQRIPFLAEIELVTQSDLIARGYDRAIVEALPDFESTDTAVMARYDRSPQQGAAENLAQRFIQVHRCFYLYDSDNDGISERHEIVLGGLSTILEDEIVDLVPYAAGCAILRSHSLEGLSLFDRLKEVQDAKTESLRQWLDNAENANNSRYAVNERLVNAEDLSNSRPSAPVRIRGEVAGNFMPFAGVDIGPSMLNLLGYLDKTRSERGGASLDLQSAEAQIAGETATGIERQYSVREQMAGLFCMTLAVTLIRNTYALTHAALRRWSTGPMTVPIGAEFVEVDPTRWPERDAWNVKRGLSYGERQRRKGALEAVIGKQEALIQAGYENILVDAAQYYTALIDWNYSAMLDNPERYFTDPRSPAAQQARKQRTDTMNAKAQADQQAATGPVRAVTHVELVKVAQKGKSDAEQRALDYWKQQMVSETELAKVGMGGMLELERLMAQGQQQITESEGEADEAGSGQVAGNDGATAPGGG